MTVDQAKKVRDRHEVELMSVSGVEGIGLGVHDGQPALTIYVDSAQLDKDALPREVDDLQVVVQYSGVFSAH